MRAFHTQHTFPAFPVYSSAFITPDELILGGGGGASRSGIKNKLRLYNIKEGHSIDLKDEYELESGEDAPMSMAAHPQSHVLVCGVNSVLEKLEKDENENCRTFTVNDSKIRLSGTKNTLPGGDLNDYQKVTVLSPDGSLLAVAGSHDLLLLSYPDMTPVAEAIHTTKEIYDASFSAKSLVVATTHNLFVYSLPSASPVTTKNSPGKRGKKKTKKSVNESSDKLSSLKLLETLGLPSSTGEGSSFRSVRYHPLDENILYAAVNTSSPRNRKSKTTSRSAYICRYSTDAWAVNKTRKVGDCGLTCFEISPDGRFLGYGSSSLVVGMLDAKTLSPLVTILKAHEFPTTTLKFNPTTTLLISGSADNSIRIVSVPSVVGSSSWTFTIIVCLTLLLILLAIVAQQFRVV